MKTQLENDKVSIFNQVLLWIGTAVSIAEIITGTLLAPLGLRQGIIGVLASSVIVC